MADIDECASGQAICPLNSECINFEGGVQCRCFPGYELKDKKCRGNTHTKRIQQQRQETTKQRNSNRTRQIEHNTT